MLTPNPLEIWLVNIPFSDLISTKVRPTLIWNQHRNEYIILGIFSKISVGKLRESWVLIAETNPDFGQTGLLKTSLVRGDKIATVNQVVFQQKLGVLPSNLLSTVELSC